MCKTALKDKQTGGLKQDPCYVTCKFKMSGKCRRKVRKPEKLRLKGSDNYTAHLLFNHIV